MRKIMAGLFISLDGVVEAPETWHFPYFNDEMGEIVGAQMGAAGTMLLGRRTYDEFAAYWPSAEDGDFAARMNGTPKLVVSTTLDEATWQNSTIVRSLDDLARIKAGEGGDLGITGSPTLVRSLIAAGLLDELRLLVHPFVVGSGKRLFEGDDLSHVPLHLAGSQVLSTGVLSLVYTPDHNPPTAAAPGA